VRPGAPAPPLEEGEELVAGRRPVEEAFAAGRPARRLLVTPQRRQALERIVLHATTLRIPIVEVEGGSLTALAGFDGHQGVAVVVDARRFASVDDILARAIERGEAAFVLALDSLEDPQNVGTLLRSAEAAGVHGVIFPTERQAPLSPAAVKASAGATEHLLLAPVDDLPGTLTDLHLRGLRIVGSDAEASLSAREADMRGPIAIVVGSEGHGLAPAVRRRADLFVRIPMRGAIGSLNAAVAGSILVFEALGQRDPGARPDERPAPRPSRSRAASGAPTRPPTSDSADAAPTAQDPDAAASSAELEMRQNAAEPESPGATSSTLESETADTAETPAEPQLADATGPAVAEGAVTTEAGPAASDDVPVSPKRVRKPRATPLESDAIEPAKPAHAAPAQTDAVSGPKPARRSRKAAANGEASRNAAAGGDQEGPAPEALAGLPAQPEIDPSDDALLPETPAKPARKSSRARPA
jgi:23S rRNA (guanosine2251-2'-O)-methyltransferase